MKKQTSAFLKLPNDMLLSVMSFLGTRKNLNALGQSCKELHALSKNEELQKYFTTDFSRPGEPQELDNENVVAMALSNDKSTLAIGKRGSFDIELTDAQSGEKKSTLQEAFDPFKKRDVTKLTFMEDDQLLVVTSYYAPRFDPEEGRMYEAGKSFIDVWNIQTAKKIRSIADIGKENACPSLPQVRAFSKNQFIVGLFSAANHTSVPPFYLCDIEKGSAIPFANIEEAHEYFSMCLSPNKKIMAHIVQTDSYPGRAQWMLRVYNIEDGKQIKAINLNDYTPFISLGRHPQIEFLKDNETIILGANQYVHTINIKTDKVLHFPIDLPHREKLFIDRVWLLPENCVALDNATHDSSQKRTIIWDYAEKKCLATFPFTCNSVIWNDQEKKIIMMVNDESRFFYAPYNSNIYDRSSKLATVTFPPTLKEHLNADQEIAPRGLRR